jgi:hypothetical protein
VIETKKARKGLAMPEAVPSVKVSARRPNTGNPEIMVPF